MRGVLKGYYGYKNFGDEVLLLWVIPYLFSTFGIDTLEIEVADVGWMETWIGRHADLGLLAPYVSSLSFCKKWSLRLSTDDLLFLGGGEVLTDGRKFPYNGRNYLFRWYTTILRKHYYLLWGIGTPHRRWSERLWRFLLRHSRHCIVREPRSHAVAMRYLPESSVTLYHDFALDVLHDLFPTHSPITKTGDRCLVNVNPYIRNETTKQRIVGFVHETGAKDVLYFPAEIGVDDQFFGDLQNAIPQMERLERTTLSLSQICQTVMHCRRWIAARLHVLLLLRRLEIPMQALVYQEKIQTFLDYSFDESWEPLS